MRSPQNLFPKYLLPCLVLAGSCPGAMRAQESADLRRILERLERLEQANRELVTEVRELRRELHTANNPGHTADSPDPATTAEKVEVQEHRVEELAQTRVEASQKFPVQITGMALFNAFANSRFNGGSDNPVIAEAYPGSRSSGATFRQTTIGLKFRGPETVWGGKVHGSVYMDFFGSGSSEQGAYAAGGQTFRLRTAAIEVDWKTRSILVGQQKPLISPREPNSLSQVGVSPLTAAGNLWLWQPQARFEQRFGSTEQTGLRAQVAVYQTDELVSYIPPSFNVQVERARPGLEGRLEFSHRFDADRRIEIAPGFHTSSSHVAGVSVPSSIFSLDWLASPWSKLQFTGAFFTGKNVAGLGALRQGFTVRGGTVTPVHARGGWGQVSLFATPRLSFNLYGGEQDDRNRDLAYGIGKNLSYAGNLMYRLAPNVMVSLEGAQVRTDIIGTGTRINNHYDLAVAYLF
jgi:hypothetical protein